MLEARKSRSGGDPGAEREVVRGGEGGGCVESDRQVHVTMETKTTSARKLSWENLGKRTGEDEEARSLETCRICTT